MIPYTINDAAAGQRLDKYLTDQDPDTTRSQWQKRIRNGGVLVNSEQPSVHQFLRAGDRIELRDISTAPSVRSDKRNAIQYTLPDIPIIADTDEYLVINKPAGVLVHDAPGDHGPTVVDFVLKKYPAVRKIGEDPMRPGIVHRIDKEVSGLLVIAKTQDMFDHLKSQFKLRRIDKRYYALVHGAPEKHSDEIRFNIDRSTTTKYKMAAVPEREIDRGRRAITEFTIEERLGNYTLLSVKPHTGRTHQIRVHLNAYNLPIVGDLVYRPKKLKTKIEIHRIFLHAYLLAFMDLQGTLASYTAPLPDELQTILDLVRKPK